MAEDASPFADAAVPARLREVDGVQWVALPGARRFAEDEVTLREDARGVTIEARPKSPSRSRTSAELAALWAEIDANKTGAPDDDWPEIEDLPPVEKDLTW